MLVLRLYFEMVVSQNVVDTKQMLYKYGNCGYMRMNNAKSIAYATYYRPPNEPRM